MGGAGAGKPGRPGSIGTGEVHLVKFSPEGYPFVAGLDDEKTGPMPESGG